MNDIHGQEMLFDLEPDWLRHWRGMPVFTHSDLTADSTVTIQFATPADRRAFFKLTGLPERSPDSSRSMWFPHQKQERLSRFHYRSVRPNGPRYPVYIISKGRADTRYTVKALERLGVTYHIVVEPQEYGAYAEHIRAENILTLPFSNLGLGSIPARNWVWDHALETGAARHWILDDNLRDFYRFQNNIKARVDDGVIFRCAEDFVDRYTNVALAGFQYEMFVLRKEGGRRPYRTNTRIYSCILVNNSVPHRWRGRYNEDTDLSLQCLKSGWVTVLFECFLCDKIRSMLLQGGNTDELYQGNGRYDMAASLVEQHPDCSTITEKWGRPQHHVDYSAFRHNRLNFREGYQLPEGLDEYGMELIIDKT